MDKHLHIVSFDVPYPADYGGVIDVFYKIVWLYQQGVKIHLHCYTKKRPQHPLLDFYCESVAYYERETGLAGINYDLPYIVYSRRSKALLTALKKDDHPILFEGVHTTYWLYKNELQNRKIFIRLHNVEYDYYERLAMNEQNVFKKIYFRKESKHLKQYEKKIAGMASLLAISQADEAVFKNDLAAADVQVMPAFTEWEEVVNYPGNGNFCLYHGSLSVNENENVVIWLIKNIFTDLPIPFIIAGREPSDALRKLVSEFSHISLYPDPAQEELKDLILNAQINVLPSFNSTGIKIKLLAALFNGRFCLVNQAAVAGSGLEELCVIAESAGEFKVAIQKLFETAYTEEYLAQKKAVLHEKYSNEKNSELFIKMLH